MKKKQIVAAAMAAVLTAAWPIAGYAGPSGTSTEEEELTERLKDNKLEYDEIADRIENYNTQYKTAKSQMVNGILSLDAAREISKEADEVMEDAKDLKSSDMDAETRKLYESYKESARELRKQAQSMTNADLPKSMEKTLRQTKNKLTKTVQNVVIQYQKALASQELVTKSVELANAQVESTSRMVELGMSSQEDLLAAQESLKRSENTAAQVNAGIQNARQNILILTGWDYNADVELVPIPEPDLSRVDHMDLQTDTQSAIWANYELQEVKSGRASGSGNRSAKKRSVSMTEQTVSSQMQGLYADVISKKQSYEAAVSEFEAASQTMSAADIKNSLGMVGRLEYLGAQVSYLNSKSAKDAAGLELFKSMETYDWAVKGLLTASGGES